MSNDYDVIIIGGGFTGLVASYFLSIQGKRVCILEKDDDIGGLARSFKINSKDSLERFYHHWFNNDLHILNFIEEIDLSHNIIEKKSKTGMFFAKRFYKLSTPLDLLLFSALPFIDRVRLGLLTFKARGINNWHELEDISAKDWLISNSSKNIYRVVWEPLLKGKFGRQAEKISAVWIWNKLKLRGGSRNKKGSETLLYYKGGFDSLLKSIKKILTTKGVDIYLNSDVKMLLHNNNRITGVRTNKVNFLSETVISTAPLPVFSEIFKKSSFSEGKQIKEFINKVSKIKYIGNICLVLILNKSLSSTYWTNVNDPDFPFVGIIEHTNFDDKGNYSDKYVVYLSKYLPTSDKLYSFSAEQFLEYSIPYIQKMFKDFSKDWIEDSFLWREPYSQPIVTKNYSKVIPQVRTPVEGLFLSCMAQIYPEDRGTNYAVRQGQEVSKEVLRFMEGT